jgi:putative nucleotidyltransferase with HDIG domain
MEAQDFSQLGHAGRVAAYALAIGRTLDFKREDLRTLYFAAILHDIGKLGSSDFSEDEAHPSRGANLVASAPLLEPSAEAIRAHHEHWDGSGFPQGLQGEEIPLNARIIAVADTFDLLSSERGTRLEPRQVELELEKRAAITLDPKLTNVFINILRRGKSTVELGQVEDIDLPF